MVEVRDSNMDTPLVAYGDDSDEDGAEEGEVVTKRSAKRGRNNPCALCGAAARYRCPNEDCGLWSCSVACSQRHKVRACTAAHDVLTHAVRRGQDERGCSGKRNRLRFVPVQEFTDNVLVDDLALLEVRALHPQAQHLRRSS